MIHIEPCTRETMDDWILLRQALWPQPDAAHRREAAEILTSPEKMVAFIARGERAIAAGFAEATLRHDYVNGCVTSPVGFLEGIYVAPGWRRRGIGRLLVRAVEDWTKSLGCTELASDANIRNTVSHRMHSTLGFEEMERVVYYRKQLVPER